MKILSIISAETNIFDKCLLYRVLFLYFADNFNMMSSNMTPKHRFLGILIEIDKMLFKVGPP